MEKRVIKPLASSFVLVALSFSMCSADEIGDYIVAVTNAMEKKLREDSWAETVALRRNAMKELLEYRGKDLRFLKREESEKLATLANRCRDVPYWPAFLVQMDSVLMPRLTVLIESPSLPEESPPSGIIHVTVFDSDSGFAFYPWVGYRPYVIPGSLVRATVVTNDVSPFVGGLLKLDVCGGSNKTLYYAVRNDGTPRNELVLVRFEHNKDAAPGVMFESSPYRLFRQQAIDDVFHDDLETLIAASNNVAALSCLLFMATVDELPENSELPPARFNEVLSDWRSRDTLDKLLVSKNPWVREYARVIQNRSYMVVRKKGN